jgi:hypothetical protein
MMAAEEGNKEKAAQASAGKNSGRAGRDASAPKFVVY